MNILQMGKENTEEVEDYSYWDMNVAVEDDLINGAILFDRPMFLGSLWAQSGATGIFEGSYYSEKNSYRPRQYSVMGCSRCEDVDPGCWTVQFEKNKWILLMFILKGLQSIINLFRMHLEHYGIHWR